MRLAPTTIRCALALVITLALSLPVALAAQAAPPSATDQARSLAVFLDCNDCDAEYVRTEVTYVDWVRERLAADVHVLVTAQGTGGGGRETTVAFLGKRRFAGTGDTLRFTVGQGATADEIRKELARTLSLGLVRFVAHTPVGAELRVSRAAPTTTTATPAAGQSTRDRWNSWVFSVGGSMNTSGESQSSYLGISGNASARRTTRDWKTTFNFRQSFNQSEFDLGDEERATFIRRSATLDQLAVKSLGPRLSAGIRSSVSSSTFQNKRLAIRVLPAVEFDIYPYSEATRRMLTLQYAAGVESLDYLEETIYFRTEETRPTHNLQMVFSQTQPWGSVNFSIEGGQYLDDTRKNFASIYGGTSVRHFRGLNLNVSGSFGSIHNQLYIPRRGATEQEILTQQRSLATSYNYYAFTGLSYTFGSVLNNVVNPRFGRSDGGFSNCFCF